MYDGMDDKKENTYYQDQLEMGLLTRKRKQAKMVSLYEGLGNGRKEERHIYL